MSDGEQQDKLKEQFEKVRLTEFCNMLDYRSVMYVAFELGCIELANLSKEEFRDLFKNIIEDAYEDFSGGRKMR